MMLILTFISKETVKNIFFLHINVICVTWLKLVAISVAILDFINVLNGEPDWLSVVKHIQVEKITRHLS